MLNWPTLYCSNTITYMSHVKVLWNYTPLLTLMSVYSILILIIFNFFSIAPNVAVCNSISRVNLFQYLRQRLQAFRDFHILRNHFPPLSISKNVFRGRRPEPTTFVKITKKGKLDYVICERSLISNVMWFMQCSYGL